MVFNVFWVIIINGDIHFTVPRRVRGWVDPCTAGKAQRSPCPRLRIATAIAINALTAVSHTAARRANDVMMSMWWWLLSGLSEPVADHVRAAGTGWFVALMLLLIIALVAVGVITAIKCRIGAIYPGQYPIRKKYGGGGAVQTNMGPVSCQICRIAK